MLNWGGAISHGYMCIVLYIYIDVPSLVSWYCRHLFLIQGISLPWVFVHCAIYETYVVAWFCRDLSIGGGQSAIGICVLFYIYIDLP